MRNMSGLTLIELMVTVAVLAILVGIAVPSFTALIQSNKVSSETNDLLASLLSARSEAVKRETNIEVEKLSGDWKNGWSVRIVNKTVPLTEHTINSGVLISNKGTLDIVRYLPSGRTSESYSPSDYLEVSLGDSMRLVCFSTIGRPYVVDGDSCP